ncbi:hypothetical protein D6D19_04170 [Aureobasidium pullulans]|uniref:P-loop containing nucleoside triphosphate hydrolase protein n=1 Tax=Aureobasidium pullulans TaxID=5580 RepID=A0A4S9A7W0_AURPU|nr:hypothetical protein D6D19_04170 [Aureobasidium pullulans]
MASRSESPEIIETSVILGKRKREQSDKPVLVKLEKVDDNKFDKKTETYGLYGDGNDDDDDSDLSSVGMSDAEDDPENLGHEPDQGEILWREADEQFPPCAPYHKDVQAIYSQITDMLDKTVDHLSGISDKSDGLQRLHEQAMETRKFPEPKMPIITLMGDAGAGKSSLISALLDTPHVSREGNFGTSCTCVITEYRKPYPQQTRKFAAKVEFLSSKDRCLLMKDYLKDYVAYHSEKDEDWTYDEEKEFSAQAKTAEGTFLDLFRGRPNFTSREEMKAYIDTAYEDEDEDATAILAQFEEWCKELASDHAPYTGSELIEADRAFELGRLVGPFLSASASWSDKPSLWPIVRKVSIGVRGPRILEHAILADLPGVSDTNRIRVRASRSYLLTSDYLWIVSPIGRCATDTSVDNLMYEFGDRFKGRLAIICTKTDDPMTFQSFAQEYQEDAKPCKKLEAKTKKAKSEMSAAKAAFKRATNPTTRQERSKAVEDSRAKYERLLHARLNTMVRIRNRKVTTLIMSEKADRLQDGAKDLVYPVSNKHYSWLKGFKDGGNEDAPQLSAEMTGIPKLRAYALSIVSHEIWATFITHIRHKVVSFIMALKAWANATSRGNNSGISDALNKSMKIIENAMTTYHGALEKETMSLLAAPMKEANSNMAKKAYKFLSKEVRIWHWCTIKAFIRRGGKYQSKVVGHQSWNAKMMLPAAKFMSSAWDELIRKEDAANKVFFATIVTALSGTLEDVREPMELMQIPKEQFQTFLDAQKHGLTSVFTTYKEEFFKQFQNVKYTTEKDDDEGYFAKAMQKIYEEAEGMKGTGYKDAVMSKLEHHVNITSDDSPFMKMANTSASQICRRAVGASEILREDCNKIFKQIFNQFGCMLDNTPDDDGSVAEVKVKLAKFLVDAEKELKKMVERLDQIEQNPFPEGFKKEEEHPIKKLKQEQEASNQVKPEPEPARARRSIKIKAEDAE